MTKLKIIEFVPKPPKYYGMIFRKWVEILDKEWNVNEKKLNGTFLLTIFVENFYIRTIFIEKLDVLRSPGHILPFLGTPYLLKSLRCIHTRCEVNVN